MKRIDRRSRNHGRRPDRRSPRPPLHALRLLLAVLLGAISATAVVYAVMYTPSYPDAEDQRVRLFFLGSMVVVAIYGGIAAFRAAQRHRRSSTVIDVLRFGVLMLAVVGLAWYFRSGLADRQALGFAAGVASTVVIDALAARVHRGRFWGSTRRDDDDSYDIAF